MAKIDENYVEKLVNVVTKKIVEAFEYLTIEDVNMYQIGYNKAIDEFAERLKEKILEEIDGVSQCQRNYEVESEMSITCSHIMGSLRDVHHRVIDQITKEMRGGKNEID